MRFAAILSVRPKRLAGFTPGRASCDHRRSLGCQIGVTRCAMRARRELPQRLRRLPTRPTAAHLREPAPAEDLLGIDVVLACHDRDRRPRQIRGSHHLALQSLRPALVPTPLLTVCVHIRRCGHFLTCADPSQERETRLPVCPIDEENYRRLAVSTQPGSRAGLSCVQPIPVLPQLSTVRRSIGCRRRGRLMINRYAALQRNIGSSPRMTRSRGRRLRRGAVGNQVGSAGPW